MNPVQIQRNHPKADRQKHIENQILEGKEDITTNATGQNLHVKKVKIKRYLSTFMPIGAAPAG